MSRLEGKNVLMVIASTNFRDEELEIPRGILQGEGAKITLASSSLNESRGVLGKTERPDVLLKSVRAEDYDALIFVGGAGASEYWDDPVAHKLVKDIWGEGRLVAAICIAPVILANAGVLKGKKAAVWSSEAEKLSQKGASCTGAGVEVDGNLITANGPQSAKEFGERIVDALAEST